MKLKYILLLSVAILSGPMIAQQIQWASKVIKFSSDLGGKQYGIKRVLGKPDAFPQGGPSANAWTPKNALDGNEIIEVGFEKPQTVKQVAVFENLNAGCVTRIMVDNGNGKYQTVWSRKVNWKTGVYANSMPADRKYYYNRKRRKIQAAPTTDVNPGVENAILEQAVPNVVAVKVEFTFALVPGQKQVDAIGISDSAEAIRATVNTTPGFEALSPPEMLSIGNLLPANLMLSPDGSQLFFTDFKNTQEVIYACSKQADGKWSAPVKQTNGLNANDTYNYLYAFQPGLILRGGREYQRGSGETGYEFVAQKGDRFESESVLKVTAYNNYDETSEATMTADRKVLLMGIETDMTQGGSDLYFANKKDDGSYGFLQSLGKTVNSAADETMPRLLSDTKTLLYCSNGFSNYGDYDIFLTKRLDDTWKNWSEPVNLGQRINSGSFDGSPCYDEKSETLYFIRTIEGKTFIYYCKLPTLLLR